MVGAILVLLVPFINTSDVRNTTYRPIFKICFGCLLLTLLF
jgi:quinol-cytochrome oxidoreductase complex cytochrome b subunit